MENARDTFYVTLRNRLAALNPGRTVVVRGVVRPGVLVEENELATAFQPVDTFCLHWTGMRVDTVGALPLVDDGVRDPVCDRWQRGQWRHGSWTSAGGDGWRADGGDRTAATACGEE